jgi:carbon-monoxide dehydrogenase medium subunit
VSVTTQNDVYVPSSVEDAVARLAELGSDGAPLAGGTWIMGGRLRGETPATGYVSLAGMSELRGIDAGDPTRIGALTTHAELARLAGGSGPLGGLVEAARVSAFPSVRNVATIGGNLCSHPFPEADLVPALLAAEATVALAGPDGRRSCSVAELLADRGPGPAELVTHVDVPAPAGRRSGYARLSVLDAGEYPLVSVALSVDVDGAGQVRAARVAVGVVAEVALRVPAAETLLLGRPLDALPHRGAADAAAAALPSRDGLDAPGWYRLAVLPSLFARAAERLTRCAQEDDA